jgi:site-specific DNA recombinase
MPAGAKTPETQLLSNVRGIFAEYERAKMLERTARGRKGRAQEGYVPHGRTTLGYVYVRHSGRGAHYEIDPEEATLVRRIFTLYTRNRLSQDALAALLTREGSPTAGERHPAQKRRLPSGTWHQSTIADILRNRTYIGIMHYGKRSHIPGKANPDKKTRWRAVPESEWIPVAVPPILDIATFEAAQALMAQNKCTSKRNRKNDYFLTNGRLRCGQCGRAMVGETRPNRHPRYRCGKKGYHDREGTHTTRSVVQSEVDALVWSAVEWALHNPDLIAAEIERRRDGANTQQSDLDRERQHYTRQLAQCDKDLKRWEAAYLGEAIDLADFKAQKAEVNTRRASAAQEMARVDEQQRLLEQAELETAALKDYCARVRAQLQHFTLEEKQRVLEVLNIAVTWHPARPAPQIEGSLPSEIFAIVNSASVCLQMGHDAGLGQCPVEALRRHR